jgi:hypothetical protein
MWKLPWATTLTVLVVTTELARTALYRNQRLDAVVDQHGIRQAEAPALSSFTSKIAHLPHPPETVAASKFSAQLLQLN